MRDWATSLPAGPSTSYDLPAILSNVSTLCRVFFLGNSFTCLITLKSAYCPRDKILIAMSAGAGGYYGDEMLLFHYGEHLLIVEYIFWCIISPHCRYISFTANALTSELLQKLLWKILTAACYPSLWFLNLNKGILMTGLGLWLVTPFILHGLLCPTHSSMTRPCPGFRILHPSFSRVNI